VCDPPSLSFFQAMHTGAFVETVLQKRFFGGRLRAACGAARPHRKRPDIHALKICEVALLVNERNKGKTVHHNTKHRFITQHDYSDNMSRHSLVKCIRLYHIYLLFRNHSGTERKVKTKRLARAERQGARRWGNRRSNRIRTANLTSQFPLHQPGPKWSQGHAIPRRSGALRARRPSAT
jgi:hypothetical protein